MKLTTSLRNTRATDIITAAGTNPKYKFYTGTESLSPAGTLLGTLNVTGALGTATSGVIDVNETVTQTNSSHVSGTPTFVLITTSADVAVATLAIPADMTFTGTIATGVDITLTAGCTLTEGNA
jgi:hypothetical protein